MLGAFSEDGGLGLAFTALDDSPDRAFFFVGGFAGIGMVMPGMFICAAAAGMAGANRMAAEQSAN